MTLKKIPDAYDVVRSTLDVSFERCDDFVHVFIVGRLEGEIPNDTEGRVGTGLSKGV